MNLYALDKCETIKLLDGDMFIKENIYRVEYLLSGEVFNLQISNYIKPNNNKYERELYKTTLLSKIKEIRRKTFGDDEIDIDIRMIPIAYEKYGLFWKPV